MTAFLLVAGAHTGNWVWEEVAGRLRESGAEAYPVPLTGMGADAQDGGPAPDLETHIQDLVRLIDQVDAPEVVLVGHCYGIHPVLGAADRRPARIARIVHLDTGLPHDGDPALASVPDPELRERLLRPAEPPGDDSPIPPPSAERWQRWGSTAGIPAAALARLADHGVPQPVRTLTQPLRLSGASAELPSSAVLCTANGSTIAAIERLVGFGDPRLEPLTRMSYFELGTGHWPMLSAPTELAAVLRRAAAGEGHRLAAKASQPPAQERPFLLDVPERPRERVGHVDLYLPDADAEQPRPAVVFVHGGPFPAGARPTPRDWQTFLGYGRYAASLGVVGVTLDHRLHDFADYGRAAEDVAAAVELARADPRVDGDRLALWFFSGGGLLSADWLAAPPPWLRCVAATYPVLAPPAGWGPVAERFRPATALRAAGQLPLVLTRVELERPEFAATVEEFLTAAKDRAADVEVIDVPLAHHGFETLDHTEPARRAVKHAMRSVLTHLES